MESDITLSLEDLKKKLRQLKKFETNTRFKGISLSGKEDFVWTKLFSTKNEIDNSVKYSLDQLIKMDKQEVKDVFAEFFYMVYFLYYKENGIIFNNFYDPNLLFMLGLPAGSTLNDIKKKFRELAKLYHPDYGGDSVKFIELIDTYHRLIEITND